MDLGAAYLTEGQPKEAQEEFTKLVAQDPNNANAHSGWEWRWRIRTITRLRSTNIKTALRLDPQARDVYYRMGDLPGRVEKV